MTVEELTLEILGERAFSQFDSKNLVDWAVNVMALGYESENLVILAGLDFDTTEIREKYFRKSIEDLKIDTNKRDEEILEKYALITAEKAVAGEISINHAFGRMRNIVSASGYDARYIAFYEIDEDLDCLRYNDSVLFNSELTLENQKEYILEELKLFYKMESLGIPVDERRKWYCKRCKKLTSPTLKTKYQLKQPFKYQTWCCGICGSEKHIIGGIHTVKRKIIQEFVDRNT
ncbi:hypothetical protein [Parapedobacter sp. DT-150]|uniref:hypothetical protein n=1 Tax=Parapedobacter sp. DT-150 TaxID=3396162 RepID=UPI003F1C905C